LSYIFIAISRHPSHHQLKSGRPFQRSVTTSPLPAVLHSTLCMLLRADPIAQSSRRRSRLHPQVSAFSEIFSRACHSSHFSVQLHETILFIVSCCSNLNISSPRNEPGGRTVRVPAGLSRDT